MTTQPPIFVVADDPKVLWPVALRLPADGGQFTTHGFHAQIRVLPEARYVELLDNYQASEEASTEMTLAENARRFPDFICGFGDDIQGADGSPIPFSVEKLQALVTGPYGGSLSRGLWDAITEVRYKARLGNFAPPPATGADTAASGD